MPIVITIRPMTPAINPFKTEFPTKPQIVERPNNTKAKISAGPSSTLRAPRQTISTFRFSFSCLKQSVIPLFISILEILVAALQAYLFAMLSALFIGAAVEEAHH